MPVHKPVCLAQPDIMQSQSKGIADVLLCLLDLQMNTAKAWLCCSFQLLNYLPCLCQNGNIAQNIGAQQVVQALATATIMNAGSLHACLHQYLCPSGTALQVHNIDSATCVQALCWWSSSFCLGG